MNNWTDVYLELCELLTVKVPEIRWMDLWNNQINFLSEEHPFPSPAVFLGFRILSVEDKGLKTQQVTLQIDTYIFYETFADTYRGSFNQGTALGFTKMITDTYSVLHGSSGANFSEMRRVGFAPVDTGGAGNCYQQSYTAQVMDFSAQKTYTDGEIKDLEINRGDIERPPLDGSDWHTVPSDGNDFIIGN